MSTDLQTGPERAATIDRFRGSAELHARASRTLAGGVSTAFRMYERPVPLFFERAEGAELVDVDGNAYVDYAAGFGPVILGHGDAAVTRAVIEAVSTTQLGGQHEREAQLAEALCRHVPAFEVVRLAVTGSEAVHAALRLARAATGRSLALKFAGHYHGWLDGTYVAAGRRGPALPDSAGQDRGAVAGMHVIDWNDEAQLRDTFAAAGPQLAAVIMEAIPCNQGVIEPRPGYLELARRLCDEHGTILIFDEVITGFRLGLSGAQGVTGVTPDLAIIGKAVGNGFPISAFGGRRDLMELVASNRVVHAGNYNGGGTSVAAALATIGRLEDLDFDAHGRMRRLGRRLIEGLRAAAADHGYRLVAQGPGPVFFTWLLSEGRVETYGDHLRADAAAYADWAELLLGHGARVIPAGRWYLTAAHTEEQIDRTIEAAAAAFADLGGRR